MKVAIIDRKDIVLKIQNSAVKFEEQTIPFRLMDILILNHRATLHTKDILKLTKENITILLISYNNDNFSLISSANTKNADIKLAQYNSQKNRLLFAKYFIEKKLISHKEHLQYINIDISIDNELQQLQEAKKNDEIMGVEGSFARLYFKYFFEVLPKDMHKNKRSKKPPQDPVNAVMSYWYSLYYNIIVTKLLSCGFEPAMGYLHTPFRTHNALASDILEIFRSSINQAIIELFKNDILMKDDFSKKGGVYLKYDGRKKIWSEFVKLVNILKPKLDEEISNLKKMIYETDSNS